MTVSEFQTLFQAEMPLIGMIHLQPLPGSPGYTGDWNGTLERATGEASLLAEAGFHGLIIENFNDMPFYPGSVPPETVAAMSVAVQRVHSVVRLPLGVNVLRNDGAAALSIAAVAGADFIRVNVLTGAMVTDQGIIQGTAHHLLRLRQALQTPVRIFADLMVKHAQPLAPPPLTQAAEELVGRGLADAVILSGIGTGKPAELDQARMIRDSLQGRPILIGSGVSSATIRDCLATADGVIVGSDLKENGLPSQVLSSDRIEQFVRAAGVHSPAT